MDTLDEQLDELETKISKQEIEDSDVSKADVGWHIEHSLLTVDRIIEAVKKSDPLHYKWSFKLSRVLVFATNKIPRGRAKSPDAVIPAFYDEVSLREHLQTTKVKIKELETISPDKYFTHPFFGNLKLDETIKVLRIHTHHHLKIINDILKSKP